MYIYIEVGEQPNRNMYIMKFWIKLAQVGCSTMVLL